MSKSKPRSTLPAPIPILPNGDFDCDPDPDPGGFLAELQNATMKQAYHLFNTPADVLLRESQRAEELDHERAKAAIWKSAELQQPTIQKPATQAKRPKRLWTGKVVDLALKIEADQKAGKIKVGGVAVNSRDAALEWAAQNYHRPSGKPFTAHSLRASLNQLHDKITGKPRH